uniref:Uncharacterized protein n=1 Tax=Leersia perrieri TaxID=77586 RepID=A0A0D9WK83_9ORYZ
MKKFGWKMIRWIRATINTLLLKNKLYTTPNQLYPSPSLLLVPPRHTAPAVVEDASLLILRCRSSPLPSMGSGRRRLAAQDGDGKAGFNGARLALKSLLRCLGLSSLALI